MRESAQNYLETILVLKRSMGQVRAVDIAGALGFSKPSVSQAMKGLRAEGAITVDGKGYIALTASGLAEAEAMDERHHLMAGWLMAMGVDEETANMDACRMEHIISEASFNAIRRYVEGLASAGAG